MGRLIIAAIMLLASLGCRRTGSPELVGTWRDLSGKFQIELLGAPELRFNIRDIPIVGDNAYRGKWYTDGCLLYAVGYDEEGGNETAYPSRYLITAEGELILGTPFFGEHGTRFRRSKP